MKDQSRRSFVKTSAATGLTFTFAGLIRAHGQSGGGTTWNPETTWATDVSTTWNPETSFATTWATDVSTTWNQEGTYVATTWPGCHHTTTSELNGTSNTTTSEYTTTCDQNIIETTQAEDEAQTTEATEHVTKIDWYLICISDPATTPDNFQLELQLRNLAIQRAGVFGQESAVGNFYDLDLTPFDPPGIGDATNNCLECTISAMGPLQGVVDKTLQCRLMGHARLREYNSSKNKMQTTVQIVNNIAPNEDLLTTNVVKECVVTMSIDHAGVVTSVPDNGISTDSAEILTSKGSTKCKLELKSAFAASVEASHDFKTAYVFTGGTQGGGFVTAETVVDWNNLGKINVNPTARVWGIRKYKLTTVYLNENVVSSHAEILPL